MENLKVYNQFGIATGMYVNPLDALSNIANVAETPINPQQLSAGAVVNDIYSSNFKTAVSGWKLSYNGDFEASTGIFRGALTVGSNAWHVDITGNMWWGNYTDYASATYKIGGDGTASLKDLTLVGGIIRYGKTSFSDSVNAGYYISSNGVYFGSASDAAYLKYAIGGGFELYGGLIASSNQTTRITMDCTTPSGEFDVFYAGVKRVKIAGYGLFFYDTGGNESAQLFGADIHEMQYTNVNMIHIVNYLGNQQFNFNLNSGSSSIYAEFAADLGTTTYPWSNLYATNINLNGVSRSTWPSAFSGNLSDLSINADKDWNIKTISNMQYLKFNTSYGQIYEGSTMVLDFYTTRLACAVPFGFQVRAGTPGAASSFQGHMYYDTDQSDLVFSNGTNWYKVTATAI